MKKNIIKNRFNLPLIKSFFLVTAGLFLSSCSTQMGAYSESDGVYYDPNKDTLPIETPSNYGNQVGDTYNYDNGSEIARLDDKGIYSKNYNWDNPNPNSDWGNYTGTEINYNNWASPYYNFGYSPYGWSFGLSFGYSWGSPWNNWYGYSPYWGYHSYYNPWYYGYNPYWGWDYPYYGYYPYYNYYRPVYPYRRSGSSGNLGNSYQGNFGNGNKIGNQNSGFRDRGFSNGNNSGFGRPSNQGQQGDFQRYRGNANYQQYNNQRPNQQYQAPRNNNNGFRSGNDGGFRPSSGGFGGGSAGGGFRSGGSGSGGGGMRSGGFR